MVSLIFGSLAFNDAFARSWTVPFVFLRFDSILNLLLLLLEIDDLFVLLLDLGHELALGLLGSLVLDLSLSEPIHDLASLAFELAIALVHCKTFVQHKGRHGIDINPALIIIDGGHSW